MRRLLQSPDHAGAIPFVEPGRWLVPDTVITSGVGAYASVTRVAWGTTSGPITGTIGVLPNPSYTVQLVSFPPSAAPGVPAAGIVVVDEVQVSFIDYDDPPNMTFSAMFTASASSSGSLAFPGFLSTGVGQVNTATIPGTGGSNPPLNITGTPTVAAWTGTYGGTLLSNTSVPALSLSSTGSGTLSLSGDLTSSYTLEPVVIGLCLYISNYNQSTGQWTLYDILSPLDASRLEILDYVVDSYLAPGLVSGYTSRSWRLSLPHPVTVGSGQALHATYSLAYNGVATNVLTFCRSRMRFIS